MILKPDLDAAYVDPFSATPMLVLFCNVVEPSTGELYGRDPRSTANARRGLSQGDRRRRHRLSSAPKPNSSCSTTSASRTATTPAASRSTTSSCRPTPAREYEGGNLAHRPRAKGGYFPVAPVDSAMDIRGEMVSTMLEMGLPMDKHHHEVAAAQHELGLTYGDAGRDRRPHADLQICRAHGRPCLRQDRDLHAQADRQG